MPGICHKIILHPNYDTYECNFWHVYSFHIWAYDIIYKLDLNYKQRSKMDQKVPKAGKIKGKY